MNFETVRLKSGEMTLRWVEGGEVFHPDIGAREESRLLIVEQLELARRFLEKAGRPLRIWDVGLGAAGNAASILTAWQAAGVCDLSLISFDRSLDPLLAAWRAHQDRSGDFSWLERFSPRGLLEEGGVELEADIARARWEYVEGDFVDIMAGTVDERWSRPDFIVYDMFSPARDYRLWTLGHWQNLNRWLQGGEGTRIVFHSRSTALRVTLLLAGFFVGPGIALGSKEETTLVRTSPSGKEPLFGNAWIKTVERSSSAHPFIGADHRPLPIDSRWLDELKKHPQFSGGDAGTAS